MTPWSKTRSSNSPDNAQERTLIERDGERFHTHYSTISAVDVGLDSRRSDSGV